MNIRGYFMLNQRFIRLGNYKVLHRYSIIYSPYGEYRGIDHAQNFAQIQFLNFV